MATEQTVRTIVLNAGADLSAALLQFSVLKLDANGDVVLIQDPADVPVGVLQNSPKDGEQALVALLDGAIVKMVAGAAIAANVLVTAHATVDGAVDDAGIAASDYHYGTSLGAAGAAGEIISVATHLIQSHA